MLYIEEFQRPKNFQSWANTLMPEDLGHHEESGWTVTGTICEDYYEWVNDFEAFHAQYGWVKGNFETEVRAKSKKAYNHFREFFNPTEWDYWDI